MIVSKMDGILLVPSPSDGLKPALTRCREVGVPTINLDTELTGESLVDADLDILLYGTSNYEGTKLIGGYVVKNFEKGTETAILKRIERQTNAADCYNEFIEGVGDTVIVVIEQTAD